MNIIPHNITPPMAKLSEATNPNSNTMNPKNITHGFAYTSITNREKKMKNYLGWPVENRKRSVCMVSLHLQRERISKSLV